MKAFRLVLALGVAVLFAGAARAQDLPFADGEEITVVDELVVRAFGGPAWWKVSDEDTTVYILASPGPIPKDLKWDTAMLKRRMTDANEVILPPGFSFSPADIVRLPLLLFRVAALDNEGEKMERKLDPALRARFVAAREKVGQPEERYGAHPPGMAALLLSGDAYEKAFPRPAPGPRMERGPSVEETVRDAAREKRVRVERSASYGIGLANDIVTDLRKPGPDCMVAVLDELDKPLVQNPVRVSDGGAAARAWAEGDVRPLLERASMPRANRGGLGTFALQTGRDRFAFRISNPVCAAPMTASKRIVSGFLDDQVKAITSALSHPGHAVALVGASDLLRKDGVLDQLRDKGFKITLPNVER